MLTPEIVTYASLRSNLVKTPLCWVVSFNHSEPLGEEATNPTFTTVFNTTDSIARLSHWIAVQPTDNPIGKIFQLKCSNDNVESLNLNVVRVDVNAKSSKWDTDNYTLHQATMRLIVNQLISQSSSDLIQTLPFDSTESCVESIHQLTAKVARQSRRGMGNVILLPKRIASLLSSEALDGAEGVFEFTTNILPPTITTLYYTSISQTENRGWCWYKGNSLFDCPIVASPFNQYELPMSSDIVLRTAIHINSESVVEFEC